MLDRNKNMDLLRVIACVMVVVLHVSGSYVTQNMQTPNSWFTIGNLVDSFMRVSVPIFVLISGAFNLSNNKNRYYGYFYKKTLKNLIIPTIISGVVYCTYSLLLDVLQGDRLTLFSFLRTYSRIITGTSYYHLWYMYMLIGLYTITPIICRSINKVKIKKLFIISFFFIGLGFINNLFINMIWPLNFINYIGYYILGYCLKQYYSQDNRGTKYLYIYILSSMGVFLLTEMIVRLNLLNKILYFYDYLSPFVIFASIGIFIYFLRHQEFKINIRLWLPHTFNIYLIHAGVNNIISILLSKFLGWQNPVWFIPCLSIIVLVISLGISFLVNKIIHLLKIGYPLDRINRLNI